LWGSALYVKELEGIAKVLGVNVNKLILGQLMYEMFAACTSTAFKFGENNCHFRSMDWGMDYLKKVPTVALNISKY